LLNRLLYLAMHSIQNSEGQQPPLASPAAAGGANGSSILAKKRKKDGLKPIITTEDTSPIQPEAAGAGDECVYFYLPILPPLDIFSRWSMDRRAELCAGNLEMRGMTQHAVARILSVAGWAERQTAADCQSRAVPSTPPGPAYLMLRVRIWFLDLGLMLI
jgi:hypothetical protein